jgi:hypothetical protein
MFSNSIVISIKKRNIPAYSSSIVLVYTMSFRKLKFGTTKCKIKHEKEERE